MRVCYVINTVELDMRKLHINMDCQTNSLDHFKTADSSKNIERVFGVGLVRNGKDLFKNPKTLKIKRHFLWKTGY